MLRKCVECGREALEIEDLRDFLKCPRSTFNRKNLCLRCHNKRTKERKKEDAEKYSTTLAPKEMMKQYGCTREEYHERMEGKEHCEICGKHESFSRFGKLCYDHDHDTMAFRGALCSTCNMGIGLLGDNIEGLTNALAYLEHHQAQQNAG